MREVKALNPFLPYAILLYPVRSLFHDAPALMALLSHRRVFLQISIVLPCFRFYNEKKTAYIIRNEVPHAKVTAYYLLYIPFYYKTFSFQKRKNTVHPVADYNSCQSSRTAWMVHCPSS